MKKIQTKYGEYCTIKIDDTHINYPPTDTINETEIYHLKQLITSTRKLLGKDVWCIYYNKTPPITTKNPAIHIVAKG